MPAVVVIALVYSSKLVIFEGVSGYSVVIILCDLTAMGSFKAAT